MGGTPRRPTGSRRRLSGPESRLHRPSESVRSHHTPRRSVQSGVRSARTKPPNGGSAATILRSRIFQPRWREFGSGGNDPASRSGKASPRKSTARQSCQSRPASWLQPPSGFGHDGRSNKQAPGKGRKRFRQKSGLHPARGEETAGWPRRIRWHRPETKRCATLTFAGEPLPRQPTSDRTQNTDRLSVQLHNQDI
jgi:hypothetical protein